MYRLCGHNIVYSVETQNSHYRKFTHLFTTYRTCSIFAAFNSPLGSFTLLFWVASTSSWMAPHIWCENHCSSYLSLFLCRSSWLWSMMGMNVSIWSASGQTCARCCSRLHHLFFTRADLMWAQSDGSGATRLVLLQSPRSNQRSCRTNKLKDIYWRLLGFPSGFPPKKTLFSKPGKKTTKYQKFQRSLKLYFSVSLFFCFFLATAMPKEGATKANGQQHKLRRTRFTNLYHKLNQSMYCKKRKRKEEIKN